MIIEIKVPTPGESVTEVELGKWLVEDGQTVSKNQDVAEIESDKATLIIVAPEAGKITFRFHEGDTIAVGTVACTIDTAFAEEPVPFVSKPLAVPENVAKGEVPAEPAGLEKENPDPEVRDKPAMPVPEPSVPAGDGPPDHVKVTAVAKKMMEEYGLSVDDILNGLRRIAKKDVEAVLQATTPWTEKKSRNVNRQKMSPLRRKLSERLVAVKNETAMLTTFNEVDMSRIMAIRKQYQEQFMQKHGFRLGFMAFFTKAAAIALSYYPMVNAMIDGEEIVMPDYTDIGIAVQSPKGLMTPVIRNAESKSVPQIELEIKTMAEKARNRTITVEELTGGTFTITNGGTFGSLLSTPIINPPQSAILGMHHVTDRPVAVEGKIEIRPMMYVALSYDHRLIDGKDSVSFLFKVKQLIENPVMLYTGGKPVESFLFDLD